MVRSLGIPVAAAAAVAAVALLGACGDDDEQAGDVGAFCEEFGTEIGFTAGFGDPDEVSEELVFFQQLEDEAPPEIADEVSTVADGLEELAEAFTEFEGVEGAGALEAIQEAGDVDLDELASAAQEVERFAEQNCEDVEPAE